jgi:mono/diheme cytochrome c family protein
MSPKARGLLNAMAGLLLAAFLVALSVQLAWTAPPAQSAADGEAIFRDKCVGCHSIGGGRLIGPDLKGVTAQRDPQWLASFIAGPDKVLAAGDPTATALLKQFNNVQMPNLGLSQAQVAAVIAYLQAPGGVVTQTTAVALPAGDPVRGKALFLGDVHLHNGGPPCMGCHSIDSAGVLGGGVMGPNLTQAFAKYGDAGLASALANIPFPVMKPIYADHPLAPEEQADLRTYIQAAASQPQANRELLVLALSLAGWIAAMIAIGIIWRRRLRGAPRGRPLVR